MKHSLRIHYNSLKLTSLSLYNLKESFQYKWYINSKTHTKLLMKNWKPYLMSIHTYPKIIVCNIKFYPNLYFRIYSMKIKSKEEDEIHIDRVKNISNVEKWFVIFYFKSFLKFFGLLHQIITSLLIAYY